ncbi:interleukin-11 isoform X1 [Panthera uncia]|uniref:interleukin-11 isoform X1 n=2 Tax=Panthera uncia TaxID=29064 RepID=UPI0020FFC7D6|nr:interleukin-11 isoform X1 [Panthera uncia]
MRERGGPGGADWLAGAGVGGAAGGWAAGEPAGRSPRGARRRRVPVRLPRPRCARVSASLRPGVCCLVLVALSLWPDRAAAPGPPPGPPRASPDPRAELDSAVLLTRSLLADTRQLAAQLVGEPAGAWAGTGTRSVEGFWARTETAGAGSLGPVCRMGGPLELGRVPLKASFSPQRDKFPADGDHNLDSLPTLAMSAGALGALQLPGVLTRLRADLFSYLRHVQWLRRAGGPSLRTLEPELGALQARLDRLLRRLQLLMSRLALPQAPPDPPAPPLAPPASAWGGIRAAHAILGGLHLTLDWAVRGLLLLKTRL